MEYMDYRIFGWDWFKNIHEYGSIYSFICVWLGKKHVQVFYVYSAMYITQAYLIPSRLAEHVHYS